MLFFFKYIFLIYDIQINIQNKYPIKNCLYNSLCVYKRLKLCIISIQLFSVDVAHWRQISWSFPSQICLWIQFIIPCVFCYRSEKVSFTWTRRARLHHQTGTSVYNRRKFWYLYGNQFGMWCFGSIQHSARCLFSGKKFLFTSTYTFSSQWLFPCGIFW